MIEGEEKKLRNSEIVAYFIDKFRKGAVCEKNLIFGVPHFHFDLEWFKTEDEYAKDTVDIVEKAVRILEENPDFRFVFDQIFAIKPWLETNEGNPERLRAIINEGRVEMVGGTLSAPDHNLPTAEEIVRQMLHGIELFKSEFGVRVRTGWAPDQFGHPEQIPQLYSRAGLKAIAFQRGIDPFKEHPVDFLWESPDGSRILAHWFAGSYIGFLQMGESSIAHIHTYHREMRARINWEGSRSVLPFLMVPMGSDFIAPRPDWFEFKSRWNKMNKVRFRFSTPVTFFKEMNRLSDRLPVVRGEFNPLFTGGYESRSGTKTGTRRVARELLDVETAVSVLRLLGSNIDKEKEILKECWIEILKNSSHDTINGTGIDLVEKKSLERVLDCEKKVLETYKRTVSSVAMIHKQRTHDEVFTVFNPLPWKRIEPVLIADTDSAGEKALYRKAVDSFGREYDLQSDGKSLFGVLEVPPLGTRTFTLLKGRRSTKTLRAKESEISNGITGISFDGAKIDRIYLGDTREVRMKTANNGPVNIIYEEDVGNLWTNGITDRDFSENLKILACEVENIGPVFVDHSCDAMASGLKLSIRTRVWREMPWIERIFDLHFTGKNRRIRASYPLEGFENSDFYCETPFAVTKRAQGTWPVQTFAQLSSDSLGISLLENDLPSYSWENGIMSATLLRSVSTFSPAWMRWALKNRKEVAGRLYQASKWKMRGLNMFESALYPVHWIIMKWWATAGHEFYYSGNLSFVNHIKSALFPPWKESTAWERGLCRRTHALMLTERGKPEPCVIRRGIERARPMSAFKTEAKADISLIGFDSEDLILDVLKPWNYGDGIVLRVHDPCKKGGKGKLLMSKEVSENAFFTEISITEDERLSKAEKIDCELEISLSPAEIRTFLIEWKH